MPTNLAEGSKRRQRRDYARFVNIAEGSLAELDYLLLLSHELGYLNAPVDGLHTEISEISKMLNSLHTQILRTADRADDC